MHLARRLARQAKYFYTIRSDREVFLQDYIEAIVCQMVKTHSENRILKPKFELERTFAEYGIDHLDRTRIIGEVD